MCNCSKKFSNSENNNNNNNNNKSMAPDKAIILYQK